MDPWWGKAAVIASSVLLIRIRAPHGQRSRGVKIAESRRGGLETALLTLAWVSFFLPFLWAFSSVLARWEYPLHPAAFGGGVLLYALGLWLFHRSHADLGTNWSITLQIREDHGLVTGGVYRNVRHPMYAALLLHSLGQALCVPNLVAGPSYLVVMGLIVGCRLGPEERMMRDRFGPAWDAYAGRSKRLLPGIW